MRKSIPIVLLMLLALPASACAHRHHHHGPKPKKVVVLDREHHDTKILIMHKKPARHRHCWKHAGHWHCRR